MKLSRVIFVIAAIIVIVWLLGVFLKFAAWLISGLFSVAAIVVIIGIIAMYVQNQRSHKSHK